MFSRRNHSFIENDDFHWSPNVFPQIFSWLELWAACDYFCHFHGNISPFLSLLKLPLLINSFASLLQNISCSTFFSPHQWWRASKTLTSVTPKRKANVQLDHRFVPHIYSMLIGLCLMLLWSSTACPHSQWLKNSSGHLNIFLPVDVILNSLSPIHSKIK